MYSIVKSTTVINIVIFLWQWDSFSTFLRRFLPTVRQRNCTFTIFIMSVFMGRQIVLVRLLFPQMPLDVCVSVVGIQFKEYRAVDSSGWSSHHFRVDSFKIHLALLTVLHPFKPPNMLFRKRRAAFVYLTDWPCRGRPFTVHTTVGWGDPLAEHLMCTSEPIMLSWLWGSDTHSGGSVKTNSQHEITKLKTGTIRKYLNIYRHRGAVTQRCPMQFTPSFTLSL